MLLDPSNFVSETLHEREVTLADSKVHKLHIREIDAGTYQQALVAMRSTDEAVRKTGIPMLIAAGLCAPDGGPALTAEQAAKLKPAVSMAIANAIFEINPHTYAGNVSTPGEGSGGGTSSPSRSAAERSPSGSA
jgi:hypothetical protein